MNRFRTSTVPHSKYSNDTAGDYLGVLQEDNFPSKSFHPGMIHKCVIYLVYN